MDWWTIAKKTGWQTRLKMRLQHFVTAQQASRDCQRRWEPPFLTCEKAGHRSVVCVWLQPCGQWTESQMPVTSLSKVILDAIFYLHPPIEAWLNTFLTAKPCVFGIRGLHLMWLSDLRKLMIWKQTNQSSVCRYFWNPPAIGQKFASWRLSRCHLLDGAQRAVALRTLWQICVCNSKRWDINRIERSIMRLKKNAQKEKLDIKQTTTHFPFLISILSLSVQPLKNIWLTVIHRTTTNISPSTQGYLLTWAPQQPRATGQIWKTFEQLN